MFLKRKLRFGIFGLLSVVFRSWHIKANDCLDSVYMRIPYTKILIDNHVGDIVTVNDGRQCLKHCKDHSTCKSVGIDASTMRCYLYHHRVYAGLPGANNSKMIYYWLLEAECPLSLGYTEDPSSKICYKYNSTKVSWKDAQSQCEDDGGYLFQDDTGAKGRIIANLSSVLDDVTYLGGTDIGEQGTWNWFNGVPVANFRLTDPNNKDGLEHCLAMYKGGDPRGIADVNCDGYNGYICEVPTRNTYNH